MSISVKAFDAIPEGLRVPLIAEYQEIVKNYLERRWAPSELSGGRFCEIVYTILSGYATGAYPDTPSKPRNFPEACKQLEQQSTTPRSMKILIPRMLPPLYEVRNNRNVGHVGGDVDPNHMDATVMLSMCSWIMAELVRVFHNLPTEEAQSIVDALVERRVPLVWRDGDVRRVLDPSLALKDQVLVLLGSCASPPNLDDLFDWLDYGNRKYFNKIIKQHKDTRLIYVNTTTKTVTLLPPGVAKAEEILLSYIQ